MKFMLAALLPLLAAAASVAQPRNAPAALDERATYTCPNGGTPVCCETDILGIADLSCTLPNPPPKTQNGFVATCAKTGKTAECCTLNLVAGIDLLCTAINPT